MSSSIKKVKAIPCYVWVREGVEQEEQVRYGKGQNEQTKNGQEGLSIGSILLLSVSQIEQ